MTKKTRTKAEQRRTAREERRAAQRAAAVRRRRRRTLVWATGGAVAVVLIAVFVWTGARRPQPGERVREAAPVHIPEGTKGVGYTSNPPSSGQHYASTAPWGVHTRQFPDELIVHNLEHGGIWISYKDPNDTDLAGKLAEVARRYPTKVIVTPRPANDAPITVVAWGHILKLQAFDEAQIVAFIDAYRGRVGPEPNAP